MPCTSTSFAADTTRSGNQESLVNSTELLNVSSGFNASTRTWVDVPAYLMFVTTTKSVAKPPKYKIAPCVRLTTSAAIIA